MLFRQGDIFIENVPDIPTAAIPQSHLVLAEGELTGHHHRMEDDSLSALFEHRGQFYLQVIADRARLVHDEHGTIVLERGTYRYWRQREYDPGNLHARGQAWSGASSRFVID